MTKKAKIYGKRNDVSQHHAEVPSFLTSKFELKEHIEVSASRAENDEIEVGFEKGDLLVLRFNDETEWIGHPEDVQEIYDQDTFEKRALAEEDFLFAPQISTAGNDRGLIKRALIKFFTVLSPKIPIPTEGILTKLGEHYDEKVQPDPGMFQLASDFRKVPIKKLEADSKHLLFLHGTLSTTSDAFGGLVEGDVWNSLVEKYGSHILALEHYTLSVSPLQNALDCLHALPSKCTIDIVSHSRGGLIADILAKCDYNNRETQVVGFSKNELSIVKSEDPVSYDLMLEINKVLQSKRIFVDKIVRVACPASGTTILSRRIDHFFNLFLNSISLAFGIRNPLYDVVKSFLLEVISQKENPEVLAGLNSMMPESYFQKMMNSADTMVTSDLYNISGDAEVGGVNFDSLKVILANLFYREANDLVVDTYRMNHGFPREQGYYSFLSQDKATNHFNYFKNSNTAFALLQALQSTKEEPAPVYELKIPEIGNRGVILDMFSMDGINYKPEKITRDVVILIPGIMGSTLAVNEEDLWIQLREIKNGAIKKQLDVGENAKEVAASGVVKKFYSKLGDYLSDQYDVISLAFDWRLSVKEAAIQLEKQITHALDQNKGRVHVLAHSMGGLVARQCMIDHQATWNRLRQGAKNKFVMLGTPWLGSYLIMEVLTGHSSRVKQLATIDFTNNRKDLLEIFWKYPGIFELLPIEEDTGNKFHTKTFWDGVKKRANVKRMPDLNEDDYKNSIKNFSAFRKNIRDFLDALNTPEHKDFFDNIYYVCGKADETVSDFRYKDRFFSRHDKLEYSTTSKGDGSVTWKTGIPEQLVDTDRLYYSNTSHGDLANEPAMFEGINEILVRGKTNRLGTRPPVDRSGSVRNGISSSFAAPLSDPEGVINTLFDSRPPSKIKFPQQKAKVRVVNADLKASFYPVLVGHFYMDLILSAEKALDRYLEERLSQRMDIGYYPGKIGESEVFFNLNTNPRGAIICGLGTTESLTSSLLAKTIRLSILKYAMFMRDNYTLPKAKKYAKGISCMLIGIGYGKLPIEESIKGILNGVVGANEFISKEGVALGLQPIEEVEIVNYYQSIASQAFYSIDRILKSSNRFSALTLDPKISKRAGIKKKQLIAESSYQWWYNLQITTTYGGEKCELETSEEVATGFKYYSSMGLARIEEETSGISIDTVDHLLGVHSTSSNWSPTISKALFEMLIPNDFKNVFRNQGNMIIKLDKRAAQIPWEMLYDPKADEVPVAVNSSFIRQMVTKDGSDFRRVSLGNKNALVIGDPDYNDPKLPPLPAAKAEAGWVNNQLKHQGYDTYCVLNGNTDAIIAELYAEEYKIMHFAGHGLYDPCNATGIAIGNGICITPAMIQKLPYVPEFVFVNCCYSGMTNAEDERYSQGRYELAANIGTQLIDMGVKAIIISGWAVNDSAARHFAETFYANMFEGYDFGSAVQKARMSCFENYPGNNTWGAYQCYGNQYYKFKNRKKKAKKDFEYVIAAQVHTDLENLFTSIRDKKQSVEKTLVKLDKYLVMANKAGLIDATVLEKEAMIYDELWMPEVALKKYEELFTFNSGNYSIEALENYCTLLTYQLTVKSRVNDMQKIEFLTLAGENPKRLNIVGNAYKMSALLTNANKRTKIARLTKAYETYQRSLESGNQTEFCGDFLDALSNMIFIGHFLENFETNSKKTKKVRVLERLKSCTVFNETDDLKKYLISYRRRLEDYDKSELDVSVQIGMAETMYCLILVENNFKPERGEDIIKRFKSVLSQLYSPRFIEIELRQIQFIRHFIQKEAIKEQLDLISEEIRKLR